MDSKTFPIIPPKLLGDCRECQLDISDASGSNGSKNNFFLPKVVPKLCSIKFFACIDLLVLVQVIFYLLFGTFFATVSSIWH